MDYLFQIGDRYKTIFGLAPDIIHSLNRKGKITSLSPSFERITGFKVNNWIGRHFSELVHTEDLPQVIKLFKQLLCGKTISSFEVRILSKRGEYLIIEASSSPEIINGKVVGAIGIARDITRHRKYKEELERSRDHLRVIFKNIADGITVLDKNGKVVMVNDAVVLASGHKSSSEMLNHSYKWMEYFELKTEDGRKFPTSTLPCRRAALGELYPEEIINYIDKASNDDRWAIVKARPIFDGNGKVYAVVNIIDDITQRKELERRKDDFISIASHELKSPLTAIRGYMHLLKNEHKSKDKYIEYLGKITNQLDKLTKLTQSLLDLKKIRRGRSIYRMKNFCVASLVQEVIDNIQKRAPHYSISFKNEAYKEVRGDREKISQVLTNLIINAIKYSPQNKKVLVKAKDTRERTHISVRDYGMGIERYEADRIFDRFYRVKDSRGKTFPGLGIGLYLSREIITHHNGRIWVESRKEKGSTFHFTLPCARP